MLPSGMLESPIVPGFEKDWRKEIFLDLQITDFWSAFVSYGYRVLLDYYNIFPRKDSRKHCFIISCRQL